MTRVPDTEPSACDACLSRSWLVGRLAGHLDGVRGRALEALALEDAELISAVGGARAGAIATEYSGLGLDRLRTDLAVGGGLAVCCCHAEYPEPLRDLAAAPAVLFARGGLTRALASLRAGAVALVGTRSASPYGIEVARALGRDLAAVGVCVVSGMAGGIDAAAHAGALSALPRTAAGGVEGTSVVPGRASDEAPGATAVSSRARSGVADPAARDLTAQAPTVAVIAGYAGRPYSAAQRALHGRIVAHGAVLSELPPGTPVRRWMLPARNRLIAALCSVTVVVEAGERSGALITAAQARDLDRTLAVVPGRITSPQARGTLGLLADGAQLVRGAQDVLDLLCGSGAPVVLSSSRPPVPTAARPLLRALADGLDVPRALAVCGLDGQAGLALLAALELDGHVRRQTGGSYAVVP